MIDIKLAVRSVFFRFRQYISLFLICVIGTGVSLSVLFISNGMLKSLSNKARIYYGGDLVFMKCPGRSNSLEFKNYKPVLQKLQEVFPKDAVISPRYDFDAGENSTSIYFEGNEVLLRVIKAVDFEKEQKLLGRLTFKDGKSVLKNGTKDALVSLPVAKKLGLKYGDTFTILLKTKRGFINTIELKVNGIFEDSSVFGMYTLYIERSDLNQVFELSEDCINRITIDFPNRKEISLQQIELWNETLKKDMNMFRVVKDKYEYYNALPSFKEDTCALVPLKANLNDVIILEKAMKLIITVIIAVLVVIIITGIGSTFRVLVAKRINEIGIYMALGMKHKHIVLTLMCETLAILIAGCFGGVIFNFIFCGILSLIDLSFVPNLNIFLDAGCVSPQFNFFMTIALVLVIIACTLTVVFFSIKKSVAVLPVKALNQNK